MKYSINARLGDYEIKGKKEILTVLKKIDKKVVKWRNTKKNNGSK